MSGANKDFQGLVDLLVREQFMVTCSVEMSLFLKERVPKDVEEMIRLAEQYIEHMEEAS